MRRIFPRYALLLILVAFVVIADEPVGQTLAVRSDRRCESAG